MPKKTKRKKSHSGKSTSKRAKSTKPKGQGDRALREQVAALLKAGGAHVSFEDAIDGVPKDRRGAFLKGLPHTCWQLLEHARIAQWDILEFSRSPKHVSPNFPGGYWPKTPLPPTDEAWDASVESFKKNLQELVDLVLDPKTDLHAKIPWGQGQTILREALLAADHNAYHLGQLVYLRRALGTWPES
jgi:hypothetical protein